MYFFYFLYNVRIPCTDIRTCRDSVVLHVRIYEHVGIALYSMYGYTNMSRQRCITCTDIRTCRDSVVLHVRIYEACRDSVVFHVRIYEARRDSVVLHVRIYEHVGRALYYMYGYTNMSGQRCIPCTDIRTCRDSVVLHV